MPGCAGSLPGLDALRHRPTPYREDLLPGDPRPLFQVSAASYERVFVWNSPIP